MSPSMSLDARVHSWRVWQIDSATEYASLRARGIAARQVSDGSAKDERVSSELAGHESCRKNFNVWELCDPKAHPISGRQERMFFVNLSRATTVLLLRCRLTLAGQNETRAPKMMVFASSLISERMCEGSFASKCANPPALHLRL
jgi:hypothetical protein